MRHIAETSDFRLPGAVVSIGMFDGVHRGHRKVLALLRERGAQHGLPTVVVTFDPHPRAIVRPDAAPMLLSSLDDRMQLLAATGDVDHCLVLHFDEARSRQSADDFVVDVLQHRLGMRELVVGANFSCGRGRQGTVAHLTAIGEQLGFGVTAVRLDAMPGTRETVRSSSTEARRLIQLGDLAGARSLLERPHEMTGTIVQAAPPSHRVLDAALAASMCAPAAADYVGAVRRNADASDWVPALLQVREDGSSCRRMVRMVAEEAFDAVFGDELRIRFHDRVGIAA